MNSVHIVACEQKKRMQEASARTELLWNGGENECKFQFLRNITYMHIAFDCMYV